MRGTVGSGSAEATARRAIRDYPENPRAHIAFAASLGQLGQGEAARAALDAAIAASPSIFRFITASRPAYYRAAEDIFGKPVSVLLYYLRSGRTVDVTEEVKSLSLEEITAAMIKNPTGRESKT